VLITGTNLKVKMETIIKSVIVLVVFGLPAIAITIIYSLLTGVPDQLEY